MRILFITRPYLNLYKEIEAEMIRQGHSVTTVLYNYVRYDPYFTISNFKRIKKFIFINLFNVHDKYWRDRVKKGEQNL